MKKPYKIALIVLGAVIAALLVLAIILPLVIDPNDYKDDIVAAVKEQTGRDLAIPGDIELSLFPWIGVELGELALSNAPGFGEQPFARLDGAGVKVALLPLLVKRVVIDTVYLNGLELNLIRNRAGKGNWEDLAAAPEQPPVRAEPTQPPADNGDSAMLAMFSIGGVNIRDANVRFDDRAARSRYEIQNLDLRSSKFTSGKKAKLELQATITSSEPKMSLPVKLSSRFTADWDAQTLDMPRLTLEVANVTVTSSLKGEKIFAEPTYSGELTLAEFNPRALMKQLGVALETADRKALTRAGIKAGFSATGDSAELKDLSLRLDDTTLSGSLAINNFAAPDYRFDLTVDAIDLDRYTAPEAPASNAKAAKAAAPAKPATSAAVGLPLDTLRALKAQGTFAVKQLKVSGLRTGQARIGLKARDGVITLDPMQAELYQGQVRGKATLNVRGAQPRLSFSNSLKGVQIGPLLRDAEVYEKFDGSGDVDLNLSTSGQDEQAVLKNLNGDIAFTFKDGGLKGLDLIKLYELGQQIRDQRKGKPAQARTGDVTAYQSISGTLKLVNGVAHNQDLSMHLSKRRRATGKGWANLAEDAIKYDLALFELDRAGKPGTAIPVRLSGKLSDPKTEIRFGEIAQQKVKKRYEKELDKEKDELKQKLEKKLERLFRR